MLDVEYDVFQSADAEQGAFLRQGTRRDARHSRLFGGDVVRRGAAAAADDVQVSGLRHPADGDGHLFRPFVILAHRIGQAGVGIADDGDFAESGHAFDERNQFFRTQRAVEAERSEGIMPDGCIEGFECLAGERASVPVARRDRHDDGEAGCHLRRGIEDGFRVERVETGLDEQQVDAAFDKGSDLFAVNRRHLVEREGTGCGIGYIGTECQRFGCRADAAGDPHRARGGICLPAGDAGAFPCEGGRLAGESVFLLGDAVGTECVGLDDVRPGRDVGAVYACHDFRLIQVECIEIAAQSPALEHRAHRPVEQQDALLKGYPYVLVCFHDANVQ